MGEIFSDPNPWILNILSAIIAGLLLHWAINRKHKPSDSERSIRKPEAPTVEPQDKSFKRRGSTRKLRRFSDDLFDAQLSEPESIHDVVEEPDELKRHKGFEPFEIKLFERIKGVVVELASWFLLLSFGALLALFVFRFIFGLLLPFIGEMPAFVLSLLLAGAIFL